MSSTVILVRCVSFDARIQQILDEFAENLPGWTVIPVPDFTNLAPEEHAEAISRFPVPALPITQDFIRDNGLHTAGNRTGWLCGDYAFYRALEAEWDFAWITEPDVYFLNHAHLLLSRTSVFDHGLLGTHYRRATEGWIWRAPLDTLRPDLEVHAMAFPLMRVSRELVEQAFEVRRSITPLLGEEHKVPNDESVMATAAHHHGHRVLELEKLFATIFRYWSTVTRRPVFDIMAVDAEPRIVHSGLEPDRYMEYLMHHWRQVTKGAEGSRNLISRALSAASVDTYRTFIEQVMDVELAKARDPS